MQHCGIGELRLQGSFSCLLHFKMRIGRWNSIWIFLITCHTRIKDEVPDPFMYKIKGDRDYSRGRFDLARENYLEACQIFKKQTWKKAVEKLQENICMSEILQAEEDKKHTSETENKGKKNRKKTKNKRKKNTKKEEELSEDKEEFTEKKEEEKEELSEDREELTKKKEEKGELTKENKVSIVVDFSFDGGPEDGVYSGYKILKSVDISLPISIIQCSDYQKQNYQKLLSLGDSGTHVLSIYDICDFTIEEESSIFFVVQPIKTVDYYYFLKYEDFRNHLEIGEDDEQSILIKWWHFIQSDFQKLFRDIVNGLIFLCLKKEKCESSMYVMNDADGKVLPSMDPNASDVDFLDDLVKKMKSIVNQPFIGHKFALEWLPIDLVHLFTSISKKKNVPMWWLLDHHYLWSREKCVDIVIKLRGLLKYKQPFMYRFRMQLNYQMTKDGGVFWADCIPDGVLKEIWRKGDPTRVAPTSSTNEAALENREWIKVAPYTQQYDVVRYMTAVYTHYNDDEYEVLRGGRTFKIVEIEQQLRACFPKIYGQIANALLYSSTKMDTFEDEVLKVLSGHHTE